MPEPNEPPPQAPFRVQKKRLGTIHYVRDDGEFGFIKAEDFREDVFFHRTVWDSQGNPKLVPQIDMFVEFEIDDEFFATEKKLRAVVVRRTARPDGRRLTGRDTPHLVNLHHPKARRKRPDWRK